MFVQVELHQIIIREMEKEQVIVLKEVDGERRLPIMIGSAEAFAINRRLEGVIPPRPMTHDLLAASIEALGGLLERIEITRLEEQTFYARLMVKQGGKTIELDSRPSDAIALGVATSVPIFVADTVMDFASA